MKRYVVPAVVLLGLIGGYVVGQQPGVLPHAANAQVHSLEIEFYRPTYTEDRGAGPL